MDEQLAALAASQDGVFTTAQARWCGVSDIALAHLQRRRLVASLGRSAYAVTATRPDDDAGRHAQSARAALLLYPDGHLCGASALAACGVALWRVPFERVELTRPVPREVLTQMCRIRPRDPLVRPVGTDQDVAAAIVQVSLDHGPLPGIVAGDHALHHGAATCAQLTAIVEALGQWPHSSRARTMLAHVDGRSESVGETWLRVLLVMAGIRVVPQVPIIGGRDLIARVDLVIDGTNVVLEFDGRTKYADGDPGVLWAEKRREDELRAQGYLVVRVVWSELYDPARLLRRIRSVIGQSSPRKSLLHPESLVG